MAWAYLVETWDRLHEPVNLEAALWGSQAIWGLNAWANGSGAALLHPMQDYGGKVARTCTGTVCIELLANPRKFQRAFAG